MIARLHDRATRGLATGEARYRGLWMKTFPTANIRNVALVGHGGAGKTSLAEALLFAAGRDPALGKVEDGTPSADFDPEEQRRRISVSLALAPFELDGHKVNLLDAPGYADFVGDVGAALRAADLALFVVSAVEGVEVQTEVAWKLAERAASRARSSSTSSTASARRSSARSTSSRSVRRRRRAAAAADRRGGRLPRSRRAAQRHAVTYTTARRRDRGRVPAEMESRGALGARRAVEGIVVGDDDLMERYLGDEKIAIDELARALAARRRVGPVFPVLCGSATKLIGIDRLAQFLVEEAPAPTVGDGPPRRSCSRRSSTRTSAT
jgi:elongation factor G